MTAIVWLRRSMRVEDNTALAEAAKEHDEVVPFYTVDDDYFSSAELGYPRVKFWHDSLLDLRKQLDDRGSELVVRRGSPIEQLRRLVGEAGAEAVYFNRDYSPYARDRDEKVRDLNVKTESFKDIVMFEKREIMTNSGDPYKVYSYYRDKWFQKEKPRLTEVPKFKTPSLDSIEVPDVEELGYEKPEDMEWSWDPSREAGRRRLEEFMNRIGSYDEERDLAAKDSTSRLSPHLKFGTVSIREAFWEAERAKAQGAEEEGVRTWQEELAWRDYYFQVLWNFPHEVEEPFMEKYRANEPDWKSKDEAPERWMRWKNGKTGYPFVDAGMRQLKREGWMHNRLRMVATNFACKDLWLDWRDVHEYFSRMFVDAELSAMLGGIQWSYSIGTDAQPYFRVFNPTKQAERYDQTGEYIREFVPELRGVSDEHIHEPWKMTERQQKEYEVEIGDEYPEPIVDHDEMRERAIERFEQLEE